MRLIDKVLEKQDLSGVTVTFDNLYTSVPLSKKLLARDMTCIGTLRSNRVGLPQEVKAIDGREAYSTQTWWECVEEYISLTSYVTKTAKKGLKNILVLSTVPPILGTERDTGRKTPGIIVRYNKTKG